VCVKAEGIMVVRTIREYRQVEIYIQKMQKVCLVFLGVGEIN
jgi:hypothetical protein